ncbi:hypothetical protein ARMGADRAFT_1032506 [Armillaria gallica]|uniref:Uncharacterized protein n=1 Tax=Armillaria gallica TaxID=47427 RepID=A0A2H3D5I0_ARMGA|nr:hypothetical protein ARMGADRAFT_1032506 [Armillaria gallica]
MSSAHVTCEVTANNGKGSSWSKDPIPIKDLRDYLAHGPNDIKGTEENNSYDIPFTVTDTLGATFANVLVSCILDRHAHQLGGPNQSRYPVAKARVRGCDVRDVASFIATGVRVLGLVILLLCRKPTQSSGLRAIGASVVQSDAQAERSSASNIASLLSSDISKALSLSIQTFSKPKASIYNVAISDNPLEYMVVLTRVYV